MIPFMHELFPSIPIESSFRDTKYVAPASLRLRKRPGIATRIPINGDPDLENSDWELHTTIDGYWYYYNPKTGQTRDEKFPER